MGSRMAANSAEAGLFIGRVQSHSRQSRAVTGSLRNIFRFPGKTRRTSGRAVHNAGSPGRGRTSSPGRERISGSSQAKRALGRLQFGESVVLEEDGRRSSAPRVHFVDAPVTGSAPAAAEAKLIFGWELIRPTWKEFVRYCSAWATKLFIPADTALGTSSENGGQSVTGQCHGRIRRRHGVGRRARNLAQKYCSIHCSTRLRSRRF